jgi:uncharacterized membrane protein
VTRRPRPFSQNDHEAVVRLTGATTPKSVGITLRDLWHSGERIALIAMAVALIAIVAGGFVMSGNVIGHRGQDWLIAGSVVTGVGFLALVFANLHIQRARLASRRNDS